MRVQSPNPLPEPNSKVRPPAACGTPCVFVMHGVRHRRRGVELARRRMTLLARSTT